jgi:hypothetical protein
MAGLSRRFVLVGAAVAIGVALGGPYAYSALSQYTTFPFLDPLLLTPIAGFLIYWWADGIHEGLVLIGLVTLSACLSMILVLSIPVFVLDTSAGGRAAVYQAAIFNTATSVLLALPFVVISAAFTVVLDTETKLLDRLDRDPASRKIVAITLALCLVGLVVSGAVGLNYVSAVEQNQAAVRADEVVVDDRVTIVVTVPNKMRAPMKVESIVLDITVNETDYVRVADVVRQDVDFNETGRFTISIERETLSPDRFRRASSVRLEGVVRISAFRGYEADLTIDRVTVR